MACIDRQHEINTKITKKEKEKSEFYERKEKLKKSGLFKN
jgi:hypothetical protein